MTLFCAAIRKDSVFIIKGFRTIIFIFISTTFRPICSPAFFRCLSSSGTFMELRTTSFIESTRIACSDSVSHNHIYQFLSLRVFGLLSSSLLPQRFGRYVLRPSSGVCRAREPSRTFELRPLLNPQGSPVLIPLAITIFTNPSARAGYDTRSVFKWSLTGLNS